MPNVTNITPPRVPVTDPRTGLISREWYRFFLNLFTITGNGSTVPVTDIVGGDGIGVSLVSGVATITNTRAAGVTSFNTRIGAVTLTSGDVTDALTYTPVNKAGDTMTGALSGVSFNSITGLSSATPGALSGTGVIGTGTDAARSDHQHPIPSSANIKTWLGYTPVNLAGDTMTGALNLNTGATSVVAGVPLNIGTISPSPFLDFYNLAAPANPSIRIQYDGTINWGVGTFPTDTYIGRYSAGVLLAQNLSLTGGLSAAGDVAGATFTLATKSINFGSKELALSGTPTTGDVIKYDGTKWANSAITYPVTSVNTQTGAVVLTASDVGAPSTTGTGASGTWGISISGNAATATSAATLTTPRAINGVNFDGSAAITVTAAAGTLTGTTLNSSVVTSSLTSVGTIGTGVWQGTVVGTLYGGTGRTDGLALGLTGSPNITVGTIGSGAVTSTGEIRLSTNPRVDFFNASPGSYYLERSGTSMNLYGAGSVSTLSQYFSVQDTSGVTSLQINTATKAATFYGAITATGNSGIDGVLTVDGLQTRDDKSQPFLVGRYSSGYPWSYMRPSSGSSGWQFVNAANSVVLLELTNAGAATFSGTIGCGAITSTGTTKAKRLVAGSTDLTAFEGDISAYRTAYPGTGVIVLGASDRYLFYDGTNYNLPGGYTAVAGLYIGSTTQNLYSPSLNVIKTDDNFEAYSVASSSTTTDNTFENTIIQKVAGGYGWNDILGMIDIRGTSGAGSAPVLTQFRSSGIYLYAFSSVTSKECFSNFHIGHDYKSGTVVYPHVHWTVNTTSTGTVRWGIEYTVAKGHQQGTDSTYGATTTVYVTQTISANSQYQHFVAEVAIGDAVAATLLEPDSVILCRFFRDVANDNFPDEVFAILTDCHYQSERFSTKNKAPNFYS